MLHGQLLHLLGNFLAEPFQVKYPLEVPNANFAVNILSPRLVGNGKHRRRRESQNDQNRDT